MFRCFRRSLVLGFLFLLTLVLRADRPVPTTIDANTKAYISGIYKKIDFCSVGRLNPKVFEYAFRGYLRLSESGKLNPEKETLTIADYSLSSNVCRLWVIDMVNYKVLFNTYVAHGQGSGEEFATQFSNRPNSHQSSLGFYVTGDTYFGQHGLSLYLHGMDAHYNSAAYSRDIVVHAADYVSEVFIAGNQRLGRSWGCPALPVDLSDSIVQAISGGSCLFVFYPDETYLARSQWLKPGTSGKPVFVQQRVPQYDKPERPEPMAREINEEILPRN